MREVPLLFGASSCSACGSLDCGARPPLARGNGEAGAQRTGSSISLLGHAARSGDGGPGSACHRERAGWVSVKAFARRSLAEQDARLKALSARSQSITLPHHLDQKYQDLCHNLAAVDPGEFDHLFMRLVVAEERKTIDSYDDEGKAGQSADIEAFVARTLPQLQRHHVEARHVALQLPGTAPLMSPSGVVETHRPSPGPA